MSTNRIWLSPSHFSQNELNFVQEAFDSNWIAPFGPQISAFESELSQFLGGSHIAALSSGTASLHLALIILGVKRDDFVLCQSFTFSASANPIAYLGARPVFVDSEKESWNLDPIELERTILIFHSKGIHPKAIVFVHLYGMPAKVSEIIGISKKYNIPLVEDAAEALGSEWNNQKCGSFGDLAILSFNGNKIITTGGGGALVCADEVLADKARFLATQAREKAPHYQHEEIGYNYRMPNILAGIGRGQFMVLDQRVAQRRSNFNRYFEYFKFKESLGYCFEFQNETSLSKSNRWITCILVDPELNKGITREYIRLELEKENIESRPLWKPMHMQPVFQDAPYFGSGVAERLFEIGLCLPSGSNLVEEDFDRIFAVLDSIFI